MKEFNVKAVMPPLLDEERNPPGGRKSTFSGTACEEIIIAHFLKQGINCARPIVDDGADIIIERDGKDKPWVRGQVKKVVHQFAIDRGMRKRGKGIVRRDEYNFFYQPTQRQQRTPQDCDYFYHVLSTPLRQLIWETPASIVPLNDDGCFISNKTIMLDRDFHQRKKAEINYRDLILDAYYHPKLIEAFPQFFYPNTVINYMP